MFIETDLTGVPVLVVGDAEETGPIVRRFVSAGAVVGTAHDPVGVVAGSRGVRLAVAVGAASGWPEVAGLRTRCFVVDEPAEAVGRGRIVLVGAGPGGAGLLTLEAIRALAAADVVLTDRLAEVGDLARFAPGAEVIDVGKRPGHHAVPQAQIEALMLERAQRGLTVVRLKGGDPYVFGRGGEEVAAAVAAGVPISVVPGVTSAIGVPGAAGIPVTHRGVSHLVTVISGHQSLEPAQADALAGLGGTIVVLMGMHNLVPITTALLRSGLLARTPAAVVERGFTDRQRSVVADLGTLVDVAGRAGVASPAVVVIGDVVRQAHVWESRAGDSVDAGSATGAHRSPLEAVLAASGAG